MKAQHPIRGAMACVAMIVLFTACPPAIDPDATIAVESVSLDKTSLSLSVGASAQLSATVSPADATDASVTWSSSEAAVAAVSESGLVSAVTAGSATVTVTTSDGGKTATCAVTVTAVGTPSSDATLKGLVLYRDDTDVYLPMSPGFDPNVLSYASLFSLKNSISSIMVLAEANDAGAIISGAGVRELNVGSNTLSVVVTAADGTTTNTYSITIQRLEFDNVYLESLSASGLDLAFDKDTVEYSINAPNALESTTITAVASSGATIEYKLGTSSYTPPDYLQFDGSVDVPLTAGDTTKVWLMVTSSDGAAYIGYVVSIVRATSGDVSADATLQSLNLTLPSGGQVVLYPSFSSDVVSYAAIVPGSVDTVSVDAVRTDSAASIGGDGEATLQVGSNTIELGVTAEDGTTIKTYTISITRKDDASLVITTPLPGATLTAGSVTVRGTFDASGTIDAIAGVLGWVDADASLEGSSYSIGIDGTGLTNGPKELIVVSRSGDTNIAVSSIPVIITDGVEGHKIPLEINLPNGMTTATGTMFVAWGESLLLSDIPLSSITFPYTVNVEGVPDYEDITLVVAITDSTGAEVLAGLTEQLTFYGQTASLTVAGADLNPVSVQLSE